MSELAAYRAQIEVELRQARDDLSPKDRDRVRVGIKRARNEKGSFTQAVPRLAGSRAAEIGQRLIDYLADAERELPADRVRELEALIDEGLPVWP